MSGYWSEMPAPQFRHLPRKTSHDTTGMLSYQAIGFLQWGQVDGGEMSDCSCGSRRMHTLRKLPIHRPMMVTATATNGSAAMRHLVQEDSRRHRHVERLGALGERDRHPLRGDRVQMGSDPGS